MAYINLLLNAFTALQNNHFALGVFALGLIVGGICWILWVQLKIIEAAKK